MGLTNVAYRVFIVIFWSPASRETTAAKSQTAQVSTLMFSFLVNGRIGGLLSFIYLVLRQLYTSTYRACSGKALEDAGLVKYTIPCYFILNGMAAAVVVQMGRYALQIWASAVLLLIAAYRVGSEVDTLVENIPCYQNVQRGAKRRDHSTTKMVVC